MTKYPDFLVKHRVKVAFEGGFAMGDTPFITVEGPIGVGKTSLAKAISAQFELALLKEIVDENPF